MSVTRITARMRRAVRLRAGDRCEYCLIHAIDTEFGCEVDHIISEKHFGETVLDNLALACFFCNRNKGSDIGSIHSAGRPDFVRFFNPRTGTWTDHFELDAEQRIIGKTYIGRVTVRILGFNAENLLLERTALRLD